MDELTSTGACTLSTVERPLRLAEFDALFTEAVRSVSYEEGLLRMHLTGPAGLHQRVWALAERESACCSFFSFVIGGSDEDLVLEVTVPTERRDILDALAARAVEVSA